MSFAFLSDGDIPSAKHLAVILFGVGVFDGLLGRGGLTAFLYASHFII
jgi:hypothetical protein